MISKNQSLALFLIITICLTCGLLFIVNISQAVKEGFEDTGVAYRTLQTKLQATLGPYCSLASFIQDQMKTMLMTEKVSETGDSVPGDTSEEAVEHIKKSYEDAYACKDELADSRPSCSGAAKLSQSNVKMSFIPCSVYLQTPAYDDSDTSQMAIALSAIPDDLATRITKEVDWYSAMIKKLQSGIDAGANPPTSLPADAPGADWKPKKEGFSDSGTCSPAAIQALLEERRRNSLLKKAQDQANKQLLISKEAESCRIPDLQSEINRVNGILNSGALKSAVAECDAIQAAAKKLQSDMIKLKAGTLYAWQNTGPTKSYTQFSGGDRTAAFLFSVQQNS